MQREDQVRLQHMLDAASKAIAFVRGKQRSDLDADEQLMLALIRLLEVLGEAARAVSPACRKRHSEIRWKEIIGTRDRLIHGYLDVDLDIVWEIVTTDLPELITTLKAIVS